MNLSRATHVVMGRGVGVAFLLVALSCRSTPSSQKPAADSGQPALSATEARNAGSSEATNGDSPNANANGPASDNGSLLQAERGTAGREGQPGVRFEKTVVPKIFAQEASTRACQASSDCAITCSSDGQCCPELCGCSQPINRSSLEKLTAHLQQSCVPKPSCPATQCAGLKRYEAKCEQGLCTAQKMPE